VNRKEVIDWQEAGVVSTGKSPFCKLRSVPIRAVKIKSGFWQPRIEINKSQSLMDMFDLLQERGAIDNFRIAAGKKKGKHGGFLGSDSDLYKWIEAVAFALQSENIPKLSKILEKTVDEVIEAQQNDGYLVTDFIFGKRVKERLQDLGRNHEFYCAGHLIQAAVAHYRATGSSRLLDVARHFADYLVATFGPGRRQGHSGHPELEMAMVELYRTTGDTRYLDFAGYLLAGLNFAFLKYLSGHAVRVAYMCSGVADYYAETGDKKMLETLKRLWEDMTSSKIYITGGIGSRYEGETFGEPFELPNMRAYTETCAAIGNIFWNWRMLQLNGKTCFADLMETILYNGFLSGVSLDGLKYFYRNPLASSGIMVHQPYYEPDGMKYSYKEPPSGSTAARQRWHGCYCCPPNAARMLASLPGYFYSISDEGVWIHLYDNSQLDWHLDNGKKISLIQQTHYPWEGTVDITVLPEEEMEFSLFLRIPNWCRQASIYLNGIRVSQIPSPGSYLKLKRRWEKGDTVHLEMEMPVVLFECDPQVRENLSSVAIQRGPLVYCLESIDNPDVSIPDLQLLINSQNPGQNFTLEFRSDFLGGVSILRGKGVLFSTHWKRPLYQPMKKQSVSTKEVQVTAIPYYAWANRGASQMEVWLPWHASTKTL